MPALFAYVIAVGLLLGGGYGALSWLAAPEPVKVAAARVKAKPPQRYEATSEAPSTTTSANQTNSNDKVASESDKAASASNDQPPSEVPVASQPATNQNAPAESSSPATPQQIRSARAEVAPVEQKPPAKQADPQTAATAKPVPPATAKIATSAAGTKTVKRPPVRQASRQPEKPPEKRRLALMILRTIQYPDGRRVNQLLPYRGGGRALAFAPDE